MNQDAIRHLFAEINIWRRGDERAPHKPLLILYALGRLSQADRTGGGEDANDLYIPYRDVDRDLKKLLEEFGPDRKSYHPEYPFWRLQNDGLWILRDADNLEIRKGSTNAKKSELLRHDVAGAFTPEIHEALVSDPQLVRDIALDILDAHFPDSLHDDILAAVGLDLSMVTVRRRRRDPNFRHRVLTAYEHRCAVCGFDVRLDQETLGIEAAHIKWHQAGGPDTEDNGLALCTLHHKTFDRGAFTLSDSREVLVSERAHGTAGFEEWLMRFHGRPLLEPVSEGYLAREAHLAWHQREVFRGPARGV